MRNNVGVHNMSAVKVLRYDRNCYMAEVTGSKSSLVVRIGSTHLPAGYTSADIKAQGNGYRVWSKQEAHPNPSTTLPAAVPHGAYQPGRMGYQRRREDDQRRQYIHRPQCEHSKADDSNYGFFSFVTALGTTGSASEWDAVINASDRYGATSKDRPISPNKPSKMKVFYGGADASSAYSWAALPAHTP